MLKSVNADRRPFRVVAGGDSSREPLPLNGDKVDRVRPRMPAVLKTVFSDCVSLSCFLTLLVLWRQFAVAALGLMNEDPGAPFTEAQFFFWAATASTLIGVPVLISRLRSFRSRFRNGIPVRARLVSVWYLDDSDRIDYEYTHNGQTYFGGMALAERNNPGSFKQGEEIIVLLDQRDPAKSIVPDALA